MFGVGLFFAFPALSRLGLTAVAMLTCYAHQRPKDACRASKQPAPSVRLGARSHLE